MTGGQHTFLGFDFGERRIGVAVGQTLTATATPLAIVEAIDGRPPWMRIEALVEEWSPDAVVVGLPLNMDGSEQDMTARARRFGNQLRGRFSLEVHFADERLSTREAHARPQAGRARRDGEPRDDVAAQIILESWMAQQLAPSGGS